VYFSFLETDQHRNIRNIHHSRQTKNINSIHSEVVGMSHQFTQGLRSLASYSWCRRRVNSMSLQE